MKTIGVLGRCDCGGKVVVVRVEAVSPRGVVDRRLQSTSMQAHNL